MDFVARDLSTIVNYVVPSGREGLINLTSAIQVGVLHRSWFNQSMFSFPGIRHTPASISPVLDEG